MSDYIFTQNHWKKYAVKYLGRVGKLNEKMELNFSFTRCFKYLYTYRYSIFLYRMHALSAFVIFLSFLYVFDISLMIEYLFKIN